MNKKNIAIVLFLFIAAIFFAGCIDESQTSRYCSDATREGTCSDTKPFFCENGKLVQNLAICGCEKDYRLVNGKCISLLDCKNGTKNLSCSEKKPFQCVNAALVEKASACGCPLTQEPDGDKCVDAKEGSETRELEYVLRGKREKIQFAVYRDLKDVLAGLPRKYYCRPNCPTQKEMGLFFLDNEDQKIQLEKLVAIIRSRATNNDDMARIAISIVQNIPYDWNSFYSKDTTIKYPYEVLFDNKGICAGKSRLLVFLLRELGYGTALFEYKIQDHEAVGIKCLNQYSLNSSGYCFVETTSPSIITNANGNYLQTGALDSIPETIIISDGASFDTVQEEFNDAKELSRLETIAEQNNQVLPQKEFNKWQELTKKYGIKPSEAE